MPYVTATQGQTVDLGAGFIEANILATKHGSTFQGAGMNVTTLRPTELQTAAVVTPFPPQTGPGDTDAGPIDVLTLSDMTIDRATVAAIAGNSHCVTAHEDALSLLRLRRCRLLGYKTSGVTCVGPGARVELEDCEAIGDGEGGPGDQGGTAFKSTGGATFDIAGLAIYGGLGGIITGDDGIENAGITIADVTGEFDHWASPRADTGTIVAVGEVDLNGTVFPTIDVEGLSIVDHAFGDDDFYNSVRALVPVASGLRIRSRVSYRGIRQWDRLEDEGGNWSQIVSRRARNVGNVGTWRKTQNWRPVTPGAIYTAYRPIIGGLRWWYEGATPRLVLWGWRYPSGDPAPPPPVGSRIDLGDVTRRDAGGIHLTRGTSGARIIRVRMRGCWADQISVRQAAGMLPSYIADCEADDGQDMAYTFDGSHVVERCVARRQGINGFHSASGSPVYRNCLAYRSTRQPRRVAGIVRGHSAADGATPQFYRCRGFHPTFAG